MLSGAASANEGKGHPVPAKATLYGGNKWPSLGKLARDLYLFWGYRGYRGYLDPSTEGKQAQKLVAPVKICGATGATESPFLALTGAFPAPLVPIA